MDGTSRVSAALGATTVALGLWLIVAPGARGYGALTVAVLNDSASGVLIAGMSVYSLVTLGRAAIAIVFSGLAAVGGLWVALAPSVLAYQSWLGASTTESHGFPIGAAPIAAAIANDRIAGFAVLVFGTMRALSAARSRT